jgi:plastocyanin
MKTRTDNRLSQSVSMVIAMLLLSAQGIWAVTHVVQFGGSAGFAYSPSSFNATVGDTVKWEGDFSLHPLSSTSVPAGAQTFHMASGSSFSYHIAVAGSYAFRCDIHFSIGMTGTFTATQSSVRYNPRPQGSVRQGEIHADIENGAGIPFVALAVPAARRITISVFDLSGRKTATLLDRFVLPGSYSIPLGDAAHKSGFYFITLQTGNTKHVLPLFTAN